MTEGLPVAIRQAISIAAADVLFDHLPALAADPQGLLASGLLGANRPRFVGPRFAPDKLERWLAELAPWAEASPAPSWRRLADAFDAAATDFARALIFEATGVGASPASVAPYLGALGRVVEALRRALREGAFSGDHEDLV